MPPPCAVEAHVPCYLLSDVSNQREPSPDKPGASRTTSSALLVAANVNPPPDNRGASRTTSSALFKTRTPIAPETDTCAVQKRQVVRRRWETLRWCAVDSERTANSVESPFSQNHIQSESGWF